MHPCLDDTYIITVGEGLPCKGFLLTFSGSIFWLLGMVSFGYSSKRSITSVLGLLNHFCLLSVSFQSVKGTAKFMEVMAVSNEFSKRISQQGNYKWKGHFYLKITSIVHVQEHLPDYSEANQQRTVSYQAVLFVISCYFPNTLFIDLMFTVWGKPAGTTQVGGFSFLPSFFLFLGIVYLFSYIQMKYFGEAERNAGKASLHYR